MTAMGSTFGLAYGDSMGKEVEFASYRSIVKRFGGLVPATLARRGQVTDDTQMMLAVGEALAAVRTATDKRARRTGYHRPLRLADVEAPLVNRFINWLDSPDNNRAPGGTCLSACRALSRGYPWWEAASKTAKGCGANMRVTPVGLCHWLSEVERSAIAQLQAALTHAHPTALIAADVTQQAVWLLLDGCAPADLLGELLAYTESRRWVWHREWLGELWAWTYQDDDALQYLNRGCDEVRRSLLDVRAALELADADSLVLATTDVCQLTGEGWVAEQALAGGLLAFLANASDPTYALRVAATSNGDSDSIAAIAGALAGAHLGEAFPREWRKKIEYRGRLEAMATALSKP